MLELKEYIKEKSQHLKFNQDEYKKRVSYAEALYHKGVVANLSSDFAYYRMYCSNLVIALTNIEEQVALGRTINKEKSRQQGISLDMYFSKPKKEITEDLARLALEVKDKYKTELAEQKKELITELTVNFDSQLQDAASKEASEKMKVVQSQLAELFE